MADQDQAAAPKKEETHINLKVHGQDGAEVFFKIKRTTQLKKLMDAYCTRLGQPDSALRFNYNGQRLAATQTPNDLQMEDGDQIDALVEQIGGSY